MRAPLENEAQVAYDSRSFQTKFDVGNTKMFEEINAGRLKARYLGHKLLILHEDGMAWLTSLPERAPSKEKAA